MQKTIATSFRPAPFLAVLVSLAALSGCGDDGLRSGINHGEVGSIGADLDSDKVAVAHHSTRCGANTAAPCPKGMDPAVEIHIDAHSVMFDFSNVAGPGSFEGADFEGYILEVASNAGSPILFATIDTDATTIDVDDTDLAYDQVHLEMNFAGVSYDRDSFVKVDLLVGPLKLLGRSAE